MLTTDQLLRHRAIRLLAPLVFVAGMGAGIVGRPFAGRVKRALLQAPPAPPSTAPYGLPRDVLGELSLFVLIGQSNMVGAGPLEEQTTDARAFVFSNDYHWRLAREPIDDAGGQVDTVSLDRAGVGPGLAFALALLERQPDLRIGLIPCAKNSSSIIQWQRNLSDQSLYGSCLKRLRAASPVGRLSGILVFQGEADAVMHEPRHPPAGRAYGRLFENFVNDFRDDAGAAHVPLVFAQLGMRERPGSFVHWELIKKIQAEINLPCVAMIVTDDLPAPDGLHFTSAAYRTVGARFANAYHGIATARDC